MSCIYLSCGKTFQCDSIAQEHCLQSIFVEECCMSDDQAWCPFYIKAISEYVVQPRTLRRIVVRV